MGAPAVRRKPGGPPGGCVTRDQRACGMARLRGPEGGYQRSEHLAAGEIPTALSPDRWERERLCPSRTLPTKGQWAFGNLELAPGPGGVIEPGRSHRAQCPGGYLVPGTTSVPPRRQPATPNAKYRFPKAHWPLVGEVRRGQSPFRFNLRADGATPLPSPPSQLTKKGRWFETPGAFAPSAITLQAQRAVMRPSAVAAAPRPAAITSATASSISTPPS